MISKTFSTVNVSLQSACDAMDQLLNSWYKSMSASNLVISHVELSITWNGFTRVWAVSKSIDYDFI